MKNTEEYVDFSKQIKKWKQVRNTFFEIKKRACKCFFQKKMFLFNMSFFFFLKKKKEKETM